MYQTSAAYEALIQQDSRSFVQKLVIDGTVVTEGIRQVRLNGGSNGSDDFSLGSAVSQYIDVSMKNQGIKVEGREIQYLIGMDINGTMEYIPMGYFTAEKPDGDEEILTFSAYDRMLKTERAYFSNLPSITNTIAVLQEIAGFLKAPIATSGLAAISISKPIGYTCREVISHIAQLYGGFAVCNRQGQIEIKTYQDNNYAVKPSRYWDTFTHNDFPFVLEKLTCIVGKDADGNERKLSVGSGAREIALSNPYMTQSGLERIWSQIRQYTYMPGSLKFLGDPRLDPWDILTVYDRKGKNYKVPCMELVQECDGGVTTSVQAFGKSETEQELKIKGPSIHTYDRYAVELALINKAIINKLDVDTAHITYATIANLDVMNQYVENLEGDYGDFKVLSANNFAAINGKINIFESDFSNIKTLLSGNAGIGDLINIHLTSENAVIDSALIRTILSEHITVNDLFAGQISTNKFRIGSDDGGLLLFGSTIQSLDKNGTVRMQVGKDAVGEYNIYIADAAGKPMWNALGIQPDAIKSPIIKDSMVAQDAHISGSKLDINSVVSEINAGSTKIQGTQVILDDNKQTLDIAFSQMNTKINGAVKGTLQYSTRYEDNKDGTATIYAMVYREGKDVTKEYPANRFSWRKKSEDTNDTFGIKTGYSVTVPYTQGGIGGCTIIGRFTDQ